MPSSTLTRRCPACDGAEYRHAFVVAGYELVRCRDCASIFVAELPDLDDARSPYLEPDYQEHAVDHADRMRSEAEARADALLDAGVRSVYEIGCGPGHFLDACRDREIWAEGIDPAITAIPARARGHVIHATFVEEFEPDRVVDAIALWEVIEHVPDPTAVLDHVRGWLRTGGHLVLSTPSMSGLPAKVLGRKFPMITPPTHLTLFTRTGLERLLRRCGFVVEEVNSFSGLGAAELERGFQRYVLGQSALGRSAARVLAKATIKPMQLADRLGLGTSFELHARAA